MIQTVTDEQKPSASKASTQISLRPTRIFRFLIGSVLLLSAISLSASYVRYEIPLERTNVVNILLRIFSLDREMNIPTYFSSVMLLSASMLLLYILVLKWNSGQSNKKYWGLLAILFVLLSLEEYIALHELTSDPLKEYIPATNSWLYFTWVVPAGALVLLLGLFFIRFLISLPAQTRNRFMLAGFLYVGGALGIEMLGAHLTATIGVQNFTYALSAHLEEILEMSGIAYFIFALTDYIRQQYPSGIHIALRK
jgi:hypothetical protein